MFWRRIAGRSEGTHALQADHLLKARTQSRLIYEIDPPVKQGSETFPNGLKLAKMIEAASGKAGSCPNR